MVNALVIVAHPDDETIWMGGTILKNKNWNWVVFSLCRKNDTDRMPKFKKVCKHYGAQAIISDLEDEILSPISSEEIILKIKENLQNKTYDYIFTHGENGEYGHIRHKEIHFAVKKMIKNGELICKRAHFFSYIAGENSVQSYGELRIPVPNKEADFLVELNEKIYNDKVKTITELYGFEQDIFETLSCGREEAFVVDNLS